MIRANADKRNEASSSLEKYWKRKRVEEGKFIELEL